MTVEIKPGRGSGGSEGASGGGSGDAPRGGSGDAPELDAIVVDVVPDGPPAATPIELSVGRGVILEVSREAALEVPEVLRVGRRGPRWRAALAAPAVEVDVRPEGVEIQLRIIARPGADLVATGRRVRDAVGLAVERLLGLEVRSVTVLVDGVGG